MRRSFGRTLFLWVVLGPMAAAFGADAPSTGEADWGLEPLMAHLHQIKAASARFVKRKYVALLTRRLDAVGTLSYVAPSSLEKITTEPVHESIVLQGETLTVTQSNGDHHTITLDDHPEIATLVEGVRSTLAGDLPTLRRYYAVEFTGGRADWQLELIPKDGSVREKVDRIRISGAEDTLKKIKVHEADGDHSEMTITPDSP